MTSAVEVEAAGRAVRVSSPDKPYFPERGFTKLDLVRYYQAVEVPLMRQLLGRPVMLQRFPDGLAGESFYQQRIPPSAPEWLQTAEITTPGGRPSRVLLVADLAHLLWAVNLGCIGFHSWAVRAPHLDAVDELRIDLDPSPGSDRSMLCDAATAVQTLLESHGITGHLKTSGNRGLHVYVRLPRPHHPVEVRRAAVALARELERLHPTLLTAAWWKEERGRRIFVDYNQNAPHRTMFAPWNVRARPAAPVSLPIPWTMLRSIDPAAMTIDVVPAWVDEHGDPWADIDDTPADIAPLLRLADLDDEAGLPDAPWPPEYAKRSGEARRVAPSRRRQD